MIELPKNIHQQGSISNNPYYGHSPPNIVGGNYSTTGYGLQLNYDQLIKAQLINNYYAFLRTGTYQRSEHLKIMSILAKFEIGVSLIYIIQGSLGDIYSINSMTDLESADTFRSLCQTNILAGVAGVLSSLVGVWALSRHRWKCTMVAYLVMAVLSSVAFLLVIIHSAIWLAKAQEMRVVQSIKIMTAIMLLVAVALGKTLFFISYRFF